MTMIRVETMKFHPLANRARVETAETAMPEKVPFHAAFLKAVDMFPHTDRTAGRTQCSLVSCRSSYPFS